VIAMNCGRNAGKCSTPDRPPAFSTCVRKAVSRAGFLLVFEVACPLFLSIGLIQCRYSIDIPSSGNVRIRHLKNPRPTRGDSRVNEHRKALHCELRTISPANANQFRPFQRMTALAQFTCGNGIRRVVALLFQLFLPFVLVAVSMAMPQTLRLSERLLSPPVTSAAEPDRPRGLQAVARAAQVGATPKALPAGPPASSTRPTAARPEAQADRFLANPAPNIFWRLDAIAPAAEQAPEWAETSVCRFRPPAPTAPLTSSERTVPAPEGPDFGLLLAAAARSQLGDLVIYTARYQRIGYPRGDVGSLHGACTDVVIRAYRALGIDLQELVHRARVGTGDRNIDHRRTETLRRFFARHGQSLPITNFPEDYRPGDIVTYYRPFSRVSRSHIAIVSDVLAPTGRPMIVHNRGWGPQLEDALFVDRITGHYRFTGSATDRKPVAAPKPIPSAL
jgi:uncharacterized protein YijF (DUF1287 family)